MEPTLSNDSVQAKPSGAGGGIITARETSPLDEIRKLLRAGEVTDDAECAGPGRKGLAYIRSD